jgi:hypothetical protein
VGHGSVSDLPALAASRAFSLATNGNHSKAMWPECRIRHFLPPNTGWPDMVHPAVLILGPDLPEIEPGATYLVCTMDRFKLVKCNLQ